MPTYVYACDECGTQFEEYQSFNSKPLERCPHGHEGKVRRVFQPVGIVFKGSGWYITDSRKSESAGVGLSDPKADSSSKSGESSSDKPAEKTADKAGEKASTSETTTSDSKSTAPSSTPASTTA